MNKNVGKERILKRLDRFHLIKGFMNDNMRVIWWVSFSGGSYHFPILLNVVIGAKIHQSPLNLIPIGWMIYNLLI